MLVAVYENCNWHDVVAVYTDAKRVERIESEDASQNKWIITLENDEIKVFDFPKYQVEFRH